MDTNDEDMAHILLVTLWQQDELLENFVQWSLAHASVDNFSHVCHKGYASLELASNFLHSYNIDLDTVNAYSNDTTFVPLTDFDDNSSDNSPSNDTVTMAIPSLASLSPSTLVQYAILKTMCTC